jgi:molybdopterin-containing oxidoreductase family membrane subunit
VVGLFNLLLFIPMLWILPPLSDGRRSLWFYFDGGDVPSYSPHIWSTLAILGLVVIGVALLWMSALPDFAMVRDHAPDGWKKRWATRLARGWIGSSAQWNMQKHRLGILGAFYFMMLIFVHFLISVDFLITLVPGWVDSLFPITHAANGLQAGVATVLLTIWALYKFGGYKDYIAFDQIWALGKLLFALSLLWFWFWFSSFNIFWYGGKPEEQAIIELLMSGPYRWAFFGVFFFNFLFPMWTMMWNPLRRSTWGPPIIAASVLIGTFLDRIRLYVSAYSIDGIGNPAINKHVVVEIPETIYPSLADIFIMLGALGGMVFIFLMATRLIPIVNIWEQRELKLYEIHKTFHRTVVKVLGKPD